ncbi:MAG TPA: dehydrogenase E1 component subunit alpha/beta [Bryobacteraceae bacterium]|nr:dehydrogenase E1 component subunit alpha/beta [Bryobacteraceae bacterium]
MLTGTTAEPGLSALPNRLENHDLVRAFRNMYLSRRIDDREILLKRQNKIFFQVSGAGHEAIQTAAGFALRPGHDWFFLYYRDRALALSQGVTPEQMFLQAVGAGSDPSSAGRQMPSHWSIPRLHIVSPSSATGTQLLPAVGCAQGNRILDPASDSITLTSIGEGATSEGEFWEAINAASLESLPVIFLIQDNGWAISVPVERETPGGDISRLVSNHPNLGVFRCDGTDFAASYATMAEAVNYCRRERKPAFVHALCTRPYSHSLSDDDRLYKTEAERAEEARQDPVPRFADWLVASGVIDRNRLDELKREVDLEVQEASDRAAKVPPPAKGSALRYLYSERVDPTSSAFDTEPRFSGDPRTMVDSINLTLSEEMHRNPRVIVFGEDVADCSREQSLKEVKGKGGVFKVTQGLQSTHGSERVFNTPIAEAAIVGRAAGMAIHGLKPVVEIQFFDYIWPAMMQIRDELASLRWRSNNGYSAPLVIRVAIGGYLSGGGIYHSQSGESIFAHIPGLRVVFPSNALDACGLLRTSLRCEDPVLFLEHKRLYREPYNRSPHPGPDYMIPFGKAKVVKPGQNLTLVTYGALVQKSLQAAVQIEQRDPDTSIEVIDLRTLSPYDWAAIRASVEKTSRVVIVHEDTLSWGYGGEISARIAREMFDSLDAPVGRVGALDTWVGYHPQLEAEILPQVENIIEEVNRILGY